MKNYLVYLIIFITIHLNAQISCDGFNAANFQHTTTVWDWRVANSTNWTAYVKDGSTFTTTTLPSPFESAASTQPNVEHFYIAQTTRDYEPTDGWELLYKNFGTALNGTDAVENPGFALYNRFTGIMRLFLFARTMPGELITGAKLQVGFNNGSSKQSNTLAYTKSVSKASDQMDKNILSNIPNMYQNTGTWLQADIATAYDPCICDKSLVNGNLEDNLSVLDVKAQYLKSTEFVDIKAVPYNFNTPIANSSSPVVNNGFPQSYGGGIIDAFKGAVNFFSSIFSSGNKVYDNTNKFLSGTNKFLQNIDPDIKDDKGKVIKNGLKLPEWTKNLPKVGLVVGALEFLVSGGKNSDKGNQTTAANQTGYKLEGSLLVQGPIDGYKFYSPGSKHQSISGQYQKPVYDYVLGSFGLLETPTLEWVQYQCEQGQFMNGVWNSPNFIQFDMPQIRQYRLKEPLKFAINPASQLQLIDMDVSIDYTMGVNKAGNDILPTNAQMAAATGAGGGINLCDGNGVCGPVIGSLTTHYPFLGPVGLFQSNATTFNDRMDQIGVTISSWPKSDKNDANGVDNINKITFSSGFFNANCVGSNSVLIAHHPFNNTGTHYGGMKNLFYENVDFKIKVKAVFRRTDVDVTNNADDIILVTTFMPNVTESSENFPHSNDPNSAHTYRVSKRNMSFTGTTLNDKYLKDYWVSTLSKKGNFGIPVFPVGFSSFPYDVTLNNVLLSNNTVIYARNKINIVGDVSVISNQSAQLLAGKEIVYTAGSVSPTVTMDISSNIPNCSGLPQALSFATIQQDYCRNTQKYNPVLAKTDETTLVQQDNSLDFVLFPNPTSGNVRVLLSGVRKADNFEVNVSDLSGAVIFKTNHNTSSIEGNSFELSTSGFANGVYFVTVSSVSFSSTKRVAVVH